MNFNDYLKESSRTDLNFDGYFSTRSRFGDLAAVTHFAIGLTTEACELMECWNFSACDWEDQVHAREEVGDMWWYIAGIARLRPSVASGISGLDHWLPWLGSNDITNMVVKSGDVLDQVKRGIYYGRFDYEVFDQKVLGAAELLVGISTSLGGAKSIMESNILKLRTRYPDSFSANLAIERDVEAERRALEGGHGG